MRYAFAGNVGAGMGLNSGSFLLINTHRAQLEPWGQLGELTLFNGTALTST